MPGRPPPVRRLERGCTDSYPSRGLHAELHPHRHQRPALDFLARARGKLTYLYFGYTHCPDACPTTMADIAYADQSQPQDLRQRILVIFVTVDPDATGSPCSAPG